MFITKRRKKQIDGFSGAEKSSALTHNPIIPLHYIESAMAEDRSPKEENDIWRYLHLSYYFPFK